MFRWCAYCWSFLGEREPLSDMSSTHGLCDRCVSNQADTNDDIVALTRPIKALHRRLTDIARVSNADEVEVVLRDGLQLGLGPIDLLVGVFQPALYQVGHLWENGAITVADEARLTRFCDRALDALYMQQRQRVPPPTGAPVFLLRAGGNAHDIGLKMLAFALREAGRDVRMFPTAPTAEHLGELCALLAPAAVGISVALPDHLRYVWNVAEALRARDLHPRVVVGGRAVMDEASLPNDVVRWTRADSLRSAPSLFERAKGAEDT